MALKTLSLPESGSLRGYLWGRGKLGAYSLLAIVLLGLALRLYRLGAPSMWTDEIMGGKVAAKSIIDIVTSPDSTPDLYYIITHLFLYFGNSDFILRLPAAIFGVLTIFAIYKAGRLFFNQRTGIIAALVVAVSIYPIMYSQEGRAYSALAFFTVASFYWFWRASESGKRSHWFWYVIATVLNMYTHASAIFVLGVQGLIMGLFLFGDLRSSGISAWKRTIRQALPPAISALAILALSVFSYKGIIAAYQFGSQASFGGNQLEFNADYYLNLLARYGAGNEFLPFFAFFACFMVGAFSAFRHNWKMGLLLLLWLAGPFIILSFYKTGHFFHVRYVIFTYPSFALLVALGLATSLGWLRGRLTTQIRMPLGQTPKFLVAAGALAFTSFSVGPLLLYYQMDARLTDYKGIAEYLKANYQPGTLILQESAYDRQLIAYYLGEQARRIPIDTANGDVEEFERQLLSGREVWYISNMPIFDTVVPKYFKQKKVFASPAYIKLGQRGLIDWDNSWFGEDLIWRYYPTLYYGLDRDYVYQRLKMTEQGTMTRKAQFIAALAHNFLYNGSFEQDGGDNSYALGWKATPGDLATITETGPAFGKRSVLLQPKTLGVSLSQRFSAGDDRFAGKVVTFGVWARSKNPSGNLKLSLFNKGTVANIASPIRVYRNVTDKWRLYTLVTAIQPGYQALEVYIAPDDGATGTSLNDIYLDRAFVVEGDLSLLTQNLGYDAFLGAETAAGDDTGSAPVAASPGVTAVEGTSETGYLLPTALLRGLEDMSLLTNGSFEVSGDDFPLSWVGTPGLTKPQQGEAPSGQKFLLLTPKSLGNALYQRFAGPDQAYANRTLTFGVWARTPNGLGNLQLTILNDGTTENITNYHKIYLNTDPSWRFYTVTATIGPNYRSLQAYIFPDDGANGDSFNALFVDGAVMVEGNFTEAIEAARRQVAQRAALPSPADSAKPAAEPATPKLASTPAPAIPMANGSEATGYTISATARMALEQASLLANGSFDADTNGDGKPDGWLVTPLEMASFAKATPLSGARAVLLSPHALGNSFYQNLDLKGKNLAGKKVTLGVWARTDSAPANLKLQILNSGTTEGVSPWSQTYKEISNEWRLYLLVTSVGSRYQRLEAYFYPDDGANGDSFNPVMIDGAFLIEGDLTEWLPKPEGAFLAALGVRPAPASAPSTTPAAALKLTLPQGSYTMAADTLQRLAAKNLAQNGSFELDANGDSRPDGWEFLLLGSGYIWEGDTPSSSRSLLLQPKFPGNAVYQVLQRQAVSPGQISLIMKARGSQTSARMRLALLGGEKSAHTVLTLQSYAQVTREWGYYGLTAPVPAGYQALALYIYPDDGTTPNDLFIDDIIVAEEDLAPLLTAARP